MTEELKGAIEVLKKSRERGTMLKRKYHPNAGEKWYKERSVEEEAIDTVISELEKPTYTAEDMQSFFSWANDNGWSYGELTELWHNDEEDLEGLIIDDVLKIWEETK